MASHWPDGGHRAGIGDHSSLMIIIVILIFFGNPTLIYSQVHLPVIDMVTGFDILGHDRDLRKHWLYRALAMFVDMLIVFFVVGGVLVMMDKNTIITAGLVSSIALFLYSGILEAVAGATIGKKIFGLRTRYLGNRDSNPLMMIFRNMPKALWYILLPIDTLIGLAGRGDPRQRLFDRLAKTTIIHTGESDYYHSDSVDDILDEANKEASPEPISTPSEEAPTKDLEGKCTSCSGELVPTSGDKYKCLGCGRIQ